MKKTLFFSLLLCGTLFVLPSCDDTDSNDPNPDPVPTTIITDTDAQNELDRVGKELIAKIDAEKIEPAISLCDYVYSKLLGFDDEEIAYPPIQGEENWQDDYANMLKDIRAVASGDFSRTATRRFIETVYRLSDYNGIYTWNEEKQDWEKTSTEGSNLEFRFSHEGNACTGTITHSGNEFTYVEKDSAANETTTYMIPAQITATLVEGNTTMATVTVNTTACDKDNSTYEADVTVTLANDYVAKSSINATPNKITTAMNLSCNDEVLVSGNGEINGEYFDLVPNIANEDLSADQIKNGVIKVNVLNSVNLALAVDNTSGLFDQMDFDGYFYESESYDAIADSTSYYYISSYDEALQKAANAQAKANKCFITMLFFNNNTYSAPCTWQPTYTDYGEEYFENEWGTYRWKSGEWDIEPVINFSNNTTYTLDTYFTKIRFSSLVDAYNDLINRF